jgi:hypothetical protein
LTMRLTILNFKMNTLILITETLLFIVILAIAWLVIIGLSIIGFSIAMMVCVIKGMNEKLYSLSKRRS